MVAPHDGKQGSSHKNIREGVMVERAVEHLRSDDILLYASDFPHWQFEGDVVLPAGLSPALRRKIAIDNPLATYGRLAG